MAEAKSRRGGGAKLSRSETVTVRLDPRLRYLAELAARTQRRTLSSFIEAAIEEALKHEQIELGSFKLTDASGKVLFTKARTLGEAASYLWDVDEADRFAKLALHHPHLLNHEEQVRWKRIMDCGYFWRGEFKGREGEWVWSTLEKYFIYERLREYWLVVCAVGRGEADITAMPEWDRYTASDERRGSLRSKRG